MCALIAGGEEPSEMPEFERWWRQLLGINEERRLAKSSPRSIDEEELHYRLSKACNLIEVQHLAKIAAEYKAEWVAADFGWWEMLQYRPGVLGAVVLKVQENAVEPMTPSFRHAVAQALGWPLQKVTGFQMGICNQLVESPLERTDEHYLVGMAIGLSFYESLKAKKIMDEQNGK